MQVGRAAHGSSQRSASANVMRGSGRLARARKVGLVVDEPEPRALTRAAIDDSDRFWLVEAGPNPSRFIGFDTNSEQFISENDVPSGGGNVRHMVFDSAANAIWFGADTHTIGRAVVP